MAHASTKTDLDEAMRVCGVSENTLTPAEKEALDQEGYLVLNDLVPEDWLSELRDAFEAACGNPANGVVADSGTRHSNDLVIADQTFEGVYTHSKILAVVFYVLQCAFRLGQLNARDPLPGYGQQGLHSDWFARAKNEPFRIVTAIWLLDDFSAENGATRVVPGTHKLLTGPPKSLAEPASRHPEQRIIVAPAGSVLAFNGHLWHSGTQNSTQRKRRVIQSSYVGRHEFRFAKVTSDPPASASAVAKYVLGA
jgi:ectoine hydroxylase-related dioxygenase (phytanoyl-CoA dioxygenase family)